MVELEVVIVNYNTPELTLRCLDSLFQRKTKVNFSVWLVDNASTDYSTQRIKQRYPKIKFIESEKNLGFAGGNNLALKRSDAPWVLLLNSDTEVREDGLDALYKFAVGHDYGILSCQLENPSGTFQSNGGKTPSFLNLFLWLSGLDDILKIPSYQIRKREDFISQQDLGWVAGTAMLISRDVIKRIGYLDSKLFMYAEDVEYCMRAKRNGFKIGWTDEARIMHIGGASLDKPQYRQWLGEFKGIIYIYQKYYGLILSFILRLVISFFVLIRSLAFLLTGKPKISLTYAKIFFTL